MSNELSLRVFHNGQMVDHKRLAHDVIKIGKLRSSHICLEDDGVAQMHAVIESSGSDIRVIDLGSQGGTYLNGQRIGNNARLGDGDALVFGSYRVEVEVLQPAAAAMPRTMGATALQPAPQPIATPAASPHAQAPALSADASDVERHDGSQVTEVLATYRGTVLDAQHVGQTRNRRKSVSLLFGAAALLIASGAALLGSEVTQDWAGYGEAKAAALENATMAPEVPGYGLGGLGMGLMLLGLFPLGLGAVRLNDRGVTSYRIGEGHDAEFHTTAAELPGDTFALVRGGTAGNVLNFTPAMAGTVALDGQSLSLNELVDSGQAVSNGSAYSYALPAGARCTVAHGELTFFVNEVAPGKAIASKSEADKPFWAYNAASCAAIGTLLAMTHLIADDAMAMDVDQDESGSRYVGYMTQPDVPEEEPEIPEDAVEDAEEAGGEGERHAGEEGAMGDPTKKAANKMYAVKGPKTALPQMSRTFDPDMQARNAGILGQIAKESGHFLASPHGEAFAMGNDDSDIWGNMTGTDIGASYGVMGLGNIGTGRGGGGIGAGTVGMGTVGLIGHGAGGKGGSGYGPGGGNGTGFKGRSKRVPRVRIAHAQTSPGIDKSIIRRIVRNHHREIVHCYNQGLVRDPNLRGRVAVRFQIAPSGSVALAAVASNTTGDKNSANCMAKAVKRWSFPKPRGGGSAMVTYPFVLSPG